MLKICPVFVNRMKQLNIKNIREILDRDERIVFAYIYGSYVDRDEYRDVDIAVYAKEGVDLKNLSIDLKMILHEHTGKSPDFYDIRLLNGVLDHGDLFSLLYLKNIFEKDYLIVDKNYDVRTDFLEKYSMKYRECEGLFGEVQL